MAALQLPIDLYVAGNIACQTFTPPAGSITDAAVVGSALIQSTKLVHRDFVDVELFEEATIITALTHRLLRATAAATIISVGAEIYVDATDASRTVTVDIQKSTGGGAFATILSATMGFTNTSTVRVAVTGTFSSTTLVAGDILNAVVTVVGGSGTQAKGLGLTMIVDRNPQ